MKKRWTVWGLCVALGLATSAAQAAMKLYGEDWESGTDLQSVTAAPYNWTAVGAPPRDCKVSDTTAFGAGTLAFDGDTANTSGVANFVQYVRGPGIVDDAYTLSADLYVTESDQQGVTGQGTAQGLFGMQNDVSAVAWYYRGSTNTWHFWDWGIGGSGQQQELATGVATSEIVHVDMVVDVPGGTITGTIVHSGGTDTMTLSGYSPSVLTSLDRIKMYSDYENGATNGMHLDNIVLLGIPEPAAVGLMVLAVGTALLRRRRD